MNINKLIEKRKDLETKKKEIEKEYEKVEAEKAKEELKMLAKINALEEKIAIQTGKINDEMAKRIELHKGQIWTSEDGYIIIKNVSKKVVRIQTIGFDSGVNVDEYEEDKNDLRLALLDFEESDIDLISVSNAVQKYLNALIVDEGVKLG